MNKNRLLLLISLLFYSLGSYIMFFGGQDEFKILDFLFGYFLLVFFLSYPLLPIVTSIYLYKKDERIHIRDLFLVIVTMVLPPMITGTIIDPFIHGYKFLMNCNHASSRYGACNEANGFSENLLNFYAENILFLFVLLISLTLWGLLTQQILKKFTSRRLNS